MNKALLHPDIQQYILKNIDADVLSIVLSKSKFDGVSQKELAKQIEAKKKCQNKLPTWFQTSQIYYPNKINIEQTSSEITAHYKSEIINGKSIADLTGGYGVDSYYFSKKMNTISYTEIDKNLVEIVAHNFAVLEVNNVTISTLEAATFLKQSKQHFDWIYLDPSRRNEKKGKVFILEDCSPNVIDLLPLLFSKTNNILIKTSPLLDISLGSTSLKFVKTIHIVAIDNDVKELNWELKKEYVGDVEVKTVNFKKTGKEIFNFKLTEEKTAISSFINPQKYLYEPNSAILKSGGYKTIGVQLKLNKIAEHTHLYTSSELIGFPGRTFRIENIINYNKNSLKSLTITKANITTRNFPLAVAELRKKHKISDGGDLFLFFYKNQFNKPQVVVCSKVKT